MNRIHIAKRVPVSRNNVQTTHKLFSTTGSVLIVNKNGIMQKLQRKDNKRIERQRNEGVNAVLTARYKLIL